MAGDRLAGARASARVDGVDAVVACACAELRALPPLTSSEIATAYASVMHAAREESDAAWAAARAAAWDAARAAAWAAAGGAAAWAAAWAAAGGRSGAARGRSGGRNGAAARDAAGTQRGSHGAAAWSQRGRSPHGHHSQASAQDLRAMCAVGRVEVTA